MSPAFSVIFTSDIESERRISSAIHIDSIHFSSLEKMQKNLHKLTAAKVFFIDLNTRNESFFSTLKLINSIKNAMPDSVIMTFTDESFSEKVMNGAFSAGADDFISKPLNKLDLTTRVFYRNELKIKSGGKINDLNFENITLNVLDHTVVNDLKREIELETKEFMLLFSLMQIPTFVFSKKSLKVKLWGLTAVTDSSLEKKLFTLRKKLQTISSKVEIKSHYGKGVSIEHAAHSHYENSNLMKFDLKCSKRLSEERPWV